MPVMQNIGNVSCCITSMLKAIGYVNIGIIFYRIGNSQSCIYNTQSKSDWLFNTQSRALQADWLILENNEKATLNINMTYCNLQTHRREDTGSVINRIFMFLK